VYILTFLILAIAAAYSTFITNKKSLFFLFVIALWFIFHDGFRWETGTDWAPYQLYFRDCLDLEITYFDIGYDVINVFVRTFTEQYSVFLIVHAVIIYSLLVNSISKYSVNSALSLLLLYCSMLSYMGMSREYLAFAICVFSIRYAMERKMIKFYGTVLFACLFHKSAVFFFIVYFLINLRSNKYYLYILGTAVIISISGIISYLPINQILLILGNNVVSDKLDLYYNLKYGQDAVSLTTTLLSLGRKLFFLFLLIFYRDTLKNKSPYFTILFNMYFISNIIYIVFNNTPLQIFISRMNLYFNVSEVLLIPIIFYLFKDRSTKMVFYIFIVFYSAMLLVKSINNYEMPGKSNLLYPYKGIIVNSDYYREMW